MRIDDPLAGAHVVTPIERVCRLVQQAIDVSLQIGRSIKMGRIIRLTASDGGTEGPVVAQRRPRA